MHPTRTKASYSMILRTTIDNCVMFSINLTTYPTHLFAVRVLDSNKRSIIYLKITYSTE